MALVHHASWHLLRISRRKQERNSRRSSKAHLGALLRQSDVLSIRLEEGQRRLQAAENLYAAIQAAEVKKVG